MASSVTTSPIEAIPVGIPKPRPRTVSTNDNPVEQIVAHAYDWTLEDEFTEGDHAAIHAWCLDRDSNPYLLRINDFPVFCHIELPLFVGGRYYQWNQRTVDQFLAWLGTALKDNKPDNGIFKTARKIYYYRGKRTYPMVLVIFRSLAAMHQCENLLGQARRVPDIGVVMCRVWETSISMIRKLLTVKEVRYSQWFTVEGYRADEDISISTLQREYIINFKTMKAISANDTKGWMTRPGILAFDIECYSNNHKAMPNQLHALHVAYMISCIYQRMGDPSSRRRYGIIIGDCDPVTLNETRPGAVPSDEEAKKGKVQEMEPVPGDRDVRIIRVNNEVEMVHEMCRIVRETDPEVLLGYNILSFDYPYLHARIKRRLKDWAPMGRIKGKTPVMNSKQWRSDAYGYNSVNILQIDGRISVDMFPLIKRDNKLDMYTLDFVTKKFLGEHRGKHDIKPEEMFRIYEELTKATATRDSDMERYVKAKEQMTRVMRYCIEDSELVIDMFEALHVWVGLVELSNVVGVSIMDLFTRGQQVRCLSQIYDLAARQGFVLDHRDQKAKKFAGAVVCSPIPGLYENIVCLDFASLYPSIMQAFNICLTTLVDPAIADEVADRDCHIIEFDQDELDEEVADGENAIDPDEKEVAPEELTPTKEDRETATPGPRTPKGTKKIHHRYKFIKQTIQEGIIPQLVRKLVEERKAVRAQLDGIKDEKTGEWIVKKETNPLIRTILDKRQLALKVTANSFFGFLGVQDGGKLPLIEGAMSITAKGRELITYVQKYLKDKYDAGIVYGDSVTADTPLLIRRNNQVSYVRIADVATFTDEHNRNDGKQEVNTKQTGIEVWSDKGWTTIKRVIRHKTNKNVYEVRTGRGIVEVTQDHSLLRPNGIEVRPRDVKVDEELLHAKLPDELLVINDCADVSSQVYRAQIFHALARLCEGKDAVISIKDLGPCNDYVYDLETDNHHFAAGIGELVVHNTDSCMVDLHITDPKECNPWGERLSKEISDLFPKPLKMEFEKGMRKLLCLKKKMYIYTFVDSDGNDKRDKQGKVILMKKGIAEARRDRCKWFRKVSDTILRLIISKAPIADCMDALVDLIMELLEGRVPYKDLLSIKELGSHYKADNYFMKVFADNLRAMGKIVNAGDRLAYLVVIPNDNSTKIGLRMRSEEVYLERLGTPQEERIDHMYYLDHVLKNPIDMLFSVGYRKDLENMKTVGYKPNGRYHFKAIVEPVKMITRIVADGKDVRSVKGLLRPPSLSGPRLSILDTSIIPLRSILNNMTETIIENRGDDAKKSPPRLTLVA